MTLWGIGLAALLLSGCVCGQTARSGNYEITLRLPADGLWEREEMEIELRILDLRRPDPLTGFAPVIRAAVEIRIEMPSMPGMPAYRETAHPEGPPGEYGVHPTFAHGGEYRLTMKVQPPGDPSFEIEFPLRVQDSDGLSNRKAGLPRYSVVLTTKPKHPKAGEPVELRFVFRDRTNPKTVFTSFETVHEALFHLILVRTDLAHFEHLHPVAGSDGSFTLRHTFPAGGGFRLFADVAPVGAGSQILTAEVSVAGDYGERFGMKTQKLLWQGGDTAVEILSPSNAFPVKKTVTVTVGIRDSKGEVRDLEPYLGAAGHFLLVHEDGSTFVHSHPGAGMQVPLEFAARLPKAGLYRGWIQVMRHGQLVTADFVVRADE